MMSSSLLSVVRKKSLLILSQLNQPSRLTVVPYRKECEHQMLLPIIFFENWMMPTFECNLVATLYVKSSKQR